MKTEMQRRLSVTLTLILLGNLNMAQTLPVSTPVVEDAYRRAQLLGELDSTISFTVRPLDFSEHSIRQIYRLDSSSFKKDNFQRRRMKAAIELLPLSWQQQYNSSVPYGWNDGSMIPARGYQTRVSAGMQAALGPLAFRLEPEFLLAGNRNFEGYAFRKSDLDIAKYYSFYNLIDLPESFGTGRYQKINWGQSHVRLTFDPVCIGISNENLWWGPGMRNALLMSNTAAGFKHLTLNTSRPVHSPIGSFETQLIAGRLEDSGFPPLEPNNEQYYVVKDSSWRYLSAFVLSYQPKWVPGLFLGLTRSFQIYKDDLGKGFNDYLPVFSAFQKYKTKNEDAKRRDQLTSFFTRWAFAKAHAELYFEYLLNDHSYNLRDFIMSPEHSRGYLAGFRKLTPYKHRNSEFIQVRAEVTQLQQSIDRIVRDAAALYQHYQVLHGYTHKGQLIGAGIGPGSNLQSFDLSWIKGLNTLGLQLERYVHNNDFYDAAFNDNGANSLQRKWIDLSATAHGDLSYKQFLFSGSLAFIRSLNYQWYTRPAEDGQLYIPDHDLSNFQARLWVGYKF